MEPDMTNGIIITYQLEYGPVGSDERFPLSQNFTSLYGIVTGLLYSTEYEFRVSAFTRVGLGSYSTSVIFLTISKFLVV